MPPKTIIASRKIKISPKEQARLAGVAQELLMTGTAISEAQNKLQVLFAQQENLKGKLAGVLEMVCESHDVRPETVRVSRSNSGQFTLTH
jgi:hypothetical protein